MLDYHHLSNLKFWWLLLYVIFVARGEQDAVRDNNVATETAASVDDDDDDVKEPHLLNCNQSYLSFSNSHQSMMIVSMVMKGKPHQVPQRYPK